ncbi:MAG: DUF4390 domain-containing protein [Gammaproteobacteria bacterium]|nr:DUF4390 domain-containing protein [Gammaproteobacteria bacterium]MDE0302968.1 DUF4390 domain-containing protein [Gammaproteobacteria bacterium]
MRAFWLSLLLLGTLLGISPAHAELTLASVKSHQAAQTVLLDLEVKIDDVDSEIPRALLRGEVWLEIEITLVQKRRLFGHQPVGRLHLLQRLSYDPLHNVYQVTRVNQQEQQTFTNLVDALARLRVLNAIPVTRLDWLLPEREQYQGEVRARLYANPMPMAPSVGSARSEPLDWQSGMVPWLLP